MNIRVSYFGNPVHVVISNWVLLHTFLTAQDERNEDGVLCDEGTSSTEIMLPTSQPTSLPSEDVFMSVLGKLSYYEGARESNYRVFESRKG